MSHVCLSSGLLEQRPRCQVQQPVLQQPFTLGSREQHLSSVAAHRMGPIAVQREQSHEAVFVHIPSCSDPLRCCKHTGLDR